MKYFDICITFLFIIKIVFILLSIYLAYLKRTAPHSANKKKIELLKKKVEFVFVILMSILVIYLFNPRYKRDTKLDYETKLLLFAFGFVSILGAKWDLFSEQFEYIQRIFSQKIKNRK